MTEASWDDVILENENVDLVRTDNSSPTSSEVEEDHRSYR